MLAKTPLSNAGPLVSVIVVNYNGEDHLAECLTALCADRHSPPKEILVVDNASADHSPAIAEGFAGRFAELKVLRSDINRGYAGGVNFGLAQARGKYIAVLNMDTLVMPGWLTAPLDLMELQAEVGAVSPLLVLEDDPDRINAVGQDIHVTGLGFNRGLGRRRSQLGTAPVRVSGIHGGAFIARRSALQAMGGLDESGFLYHEDVDFSWLLQLMGYDIYCVPLGVVRHKYFLTMYPEKLYLLERNRCAMLVAHLEAASLFLLAPLLACTEAMMWGYCLLRGRDFLKAKAASYRWVASQWPRLKARRGFIRLLRQRSDWQVLARLPWGYAWDQFLTLGRERGKSARQPRGGLPVKIGGAT